MKILLLLVLSCALGACSTRDGNIGQAPTVRRVAVNYGGRAGDEAVDSAGRRIGQHVANRGTSMALGAAGLGWAGEVLNLARIAQGPGKKTKGITPAFQQQCLLGGVDPLTETAKAFERRLARDGSYQLETTNPEAAFTFKILRADMEPVDALGQSCRPTLTVLATLVDRSGKTLWQRQSSGAGRAHTWREYGNSASLFRTELAAASAAVTEGLFAGLR